MNIRRLRKLVKFVQENPHRYNQNQWCGTTACLAGHAAVLAGVDEENIFTEHPEPGISLRVEDTASAWLGLNAHQAQQLFDTVSGLSSDLWPRRFIVRYHRAKTDKTRANVAAARIEHFIKTGGAK